MEGDVFEGYRFSSLDFVNHLVLLGSSALTQKLPYRGSDAAMSYGGRLPTVAGGFRRGSVSER